MSVVPVTKDPSRSIAECAHDCAQDIAAIGKQIMDFMLDRNKRASKEKLLNLVVLFEQKLERMKELVQLSPQYRERAELITQLEKCVENRDNIIQRYADNLRGAEQVLTHGIFQANNKLKRVAEANANPVYSEEVLKFAHQISKGYSVSAPLSWTVGDPTRPFPTEQEMSRSSLSGSRPLEMRRQGWIGASASPGVPARVASSPGLWSPRTSYSTTSQSPRGRGGTMGGGTPSGSSTGGQTPRRGPELSPFGRRAEVAKRSVPMAPPVAPPEQMSSDSSSSSSSDDES